MPFDLFKGCSGLFIGRSSATLALDLKIDCQACDIFVADDFPIGKLEGK